MKFKPSVQSLDWTARRRECPRTGRTVVDGGRLPRRHQNSAYCLGDLSAAGMHCRRSSRPRSRHDRGGLVVVDVRRFGRRRFRNIFMHLVLAHDILPNNTSAIRPIQAPSVRQLGRGRAPSSPITDGTDYLSTVRPELKRDYQNPVRTGLCGTLLGTYLLGLHCLSSSRS